MLFVFYGNDTIGVRTKAYDFVAIHEKKGEVLQRIDGENYAPGILSDIAGSASLFGTKTIYLIDTPSVSKDFYNDVVEHLEALAQSATHFVVAEEALLAPEKKKFAKHAESIEEVKGATKERFNAFGMADSLARKDKKTLWMQLQDAKREGLSPEEIIGTLWWQLKSLRLAKQTGSAQEAGMKDFPYNKAKRALLAFKEGELEALSHSLLRVYHDGHLGKKDIDLALEKWVLSV